MQQCTFYFVRHAHAEWTPDENRPLSPQGMTQAVRVADALFQTPITRISSSPYRRAKQTVQPLAARLGLAITIEADLRECSLGDFGHRLGFFGAVKQTWQKPEFSFPGGEANVVAQKRGVAVVQRLLAECAAEHVVLATHGTLMALVLQHFDRRLGFAFWGSLSMPDIYALRMEGEELSLNRLWQNSEKDHVVQ